MSRRVVVVGGGLAGIAAAIELARAGRPVVLVERRPFLGGRVFSFRDPDTGAVIDNGQHVLAGACTRLRAFLDTIGSPRGAFVRQRRLEVPVLDGRGRLETISAARLPAPLHALAALLRYGHLPLRDGIATARHVAALTRTPDRASLDAVPLGAWLAERGVSDASLVRFWDPLVRPALNVPVEEANAALAAFFLERAIWSRGSGGALWLPALGLSEAIGDPAESALRALGVDLRLGSRASGLAAPTGRVEGVELADGETIGAEHVVAAVPPDALARLLGADAPGADLGTSAIVNVYLWYDRPVSPVAFAGTFDGPLQWIFDRTRLLGHETAGGECLGISLSAADEALDASKEDLADRIDEAVGRVFPERRGARRRAFAVVKEPRATFRAGPDLRARRPGPDTAAPGLLLAGDWTDTGWPATMEGAVRSGEAAARLVLEPRVDAGRGAAR